MLTIASWQSLTPKPVEALAGTSDKFLHVLCWFVLAIALRMAFDKRFLLNCGLLFTYSVLIECGQILVTNRFFSWLDIVANGVGIMLASALILFYLTFIAKSQ